VIVFTAHTHPARAPVLVPERFSWAALIFGPLWLAAHRAWIAAAVLLLLDLLATRLPEPGWRPYVSLALAVLAGLLGNDLRRWSLARRGRPAVHVVAARNRDEAYARLLLARPDLLPAGIR
jgi:hypothetical protein